MGAHRIPSNLESIRSFGTKALKECKGLTVDQRIHRHVSMLQMTELPLSVRRGHRYKALRIIARLARAGDLTVESVLAGLHLSPEDLKVSKNK